MADHDGSFACIIGDLQESLVNDAVEVAVARRHAEAAMACPGAFSEEGTTLFYRCILQYCGVGVLKSCNPKSCVMARLLDWYVAGLEGLTEKETTVRRILVQQIEFDRSGLDIKQVEKKKRVANECDDGGVEYLGDLFDVEGCGAVESDSICRLLKWVSDVGGEGERVGLGDLTKARGLVKLFLNPLWIDQVDPPQSSDAVDETKFSAERKFQVVESDGKAESSHDGKVGPREGSENLVLDLIGHSEPLACGELFRILASGVIGTVYDDEPSLDFAIKRVIQALDRVLDRGSEGVLQAVLPQLKSCLDDASPHGKNLAVAVLMSGMRSEAEGWWWAAFHSFFVEIATGMTVDDNVEVIFCAIELLGEASLDKNLRQSRSGEWILERLYLMTCLFAGSDSGALCSRVDLDKIEGIFHIEKLKGAKSIEMEDGSIIDWIYCMRVMAVHYALHSSQTIVRSVLRLCMCHESSIETLGLLESCMTDESVATWVAMCSMSDVEMLMTVLHHAELSHCNIVPWNKLVQLVHAVFVTEKGRACCLTAITAERSTTTLERMIAAADFMGEDPISVRSIVSIASICDDSRVQKDVGARLAGGWGECMLRNDPDLLALKACVHLLANHDSAAIKSQTEEGEGPCSGLGSFIERILNRAANVESTCFKSWLPTLAQLHLDSESLSPLHSAVKIKFPLILSLLDGEKNMGDRNAAVSLVGHLMELNEEDRDLLQVSYKSKSGAVLPGRRAKSAAAGQRDEEMGFFTSVAGHSVREASNNDSSLDLQREVGILTRAQEPEYQVEVMSDSVENGGGSARGPVEYSKSDMVMTKTAQENLDRLLAAAANGIPVLLKGATGVGKTATVIDAARQRNRSLVQISMSSRVSPDGLLAKTSLKVNGLGEQEICFELQSFAEAFQKGWWVLLEGLNIAEEKTLECIEHALDTGRLTIRDDSSAHESIRVLEKHADFMLFATENPSAERRFRETMTGKLSESLLSRFSLVVFEQLPESEWVDIVIDRLSYGFHPEGEKPQKEDIETLAKRMVEIHVRIVKGMREKLFAEKGAYATITIRELLMWCDLLCKCEGRRMIDLAWLVYGARFRHKGGELVRKELIKAGFDDPNNSSPQRNDKILEVLCKERGVIPAGWVILNEGAWEENMRGVSYPDGASILKQCEAVHREIGRLVLSPDFISKHGLQIDFCDMWLWKWIQDGASRSLLLPSLADQLGAAGASLYASKFRHKAARERIVQVFQQAFVWNEDLAVENNSAVGGQARAPLMLGSRFLRDLDLIQLAVRSRLPVLVEGKSGCGKSALVKALSFILGKEHMEHVSLTPESEPSALLKQPVLTDSKRAEVWWMDGPLTWAYANGSFLLVDNLGQAKAAMLELLNPMLEVPRMLYLWELGDSGPLKSRLTGDGSLSEGPAEGFSFLATFTPPGESSSGCDMLSNELSPALANRFSIIHVDDLVEKSHETFREEIKGLAAILMDCPDKAAQNRVAEFCWNIHQKLLPERNQFASLTMRSYIQMIDSAYLLQKQHMHGQRSLDLALKAAFDLTFGPQLKDQRLREQVEKVVHESLGSMSDSAGEEKLRFLEELPPPSDLVLTDSRKKHAAAILAGVAVNRPVLLEGPPAVGKTALVIGLQKGLPSVQGSKVEILNNSATTTVQDYFGSWRQLNGKFVYCPGILVKAMDEGSWFLADNLNLAPLPVISALAPVLEGCTNIDIPGASMSVEVHPDFRFFATQNDHETVGRNLLPINTRNRFLEVKIADFPVGELRQVIELRFRGLPEGEAMTPEVAAQLENFYFALEERQVGFTIRQTIKVVRRFTMFAFYTPENPPFWSHVALSLLRPQYHGSKEWKKVMDAAQSVPGWENAVSLPSDREWPVSVEPVGKSEVCFREGPLCLTLPNINLDLSKHWMGGAVPPTAFLRKLVHLAFAISAGEPVLLSGPTSFKTELIRTWAAISGRLNDTITLHITGETDAHDLHGRVNPMSFPELLKLLPVLGDEVYARYTLLHQENGSGKKPLEDRLSALLSPTLPNVLSEFADQLGKGEPSPECTEIDPSRDSLEGIAFDSEFSRIPSTQEKGKMDTVLVSELSNATSSMGGRVFTDDGFGGGAPEGAGDKIDPEVDDVDLYDFCDVSGSEHGRETRSSLGEDGDGNFDNSGFSMPVADREVLEMNAWTKNDAHSEEGAEFGEPLASMSCQSTSTVPKKVVAVMTELIQLFDRITPANSEFGLLRLLERFKNVWAAIQGASSSNDDPFSMFIDGPVARAASMGQMLVLEDIDACLQSVTERLNSLVEADPVFSLPEDMTSASSPSSKKSMELSVPQESFQILATVHMDSSKPQASLSSATESRFTVISCPEYCVEELQQVLELELKKRLDGSQTEQAESIANRIMHLRKLVLEEHPRLHACSDVRRAFRWVDFICNQDADMSIDHRVLLGAKFFYLDELTSGVEQDLEKRWWGHFGLDCNLLSIINIEEKLAKSDLEKSGKPFELDGDASPSIMHTEEEEQPPEKDVPPFQVKLSEDGLARAIELRCAAGVRGELMAPEPGLTDAKLHERLKFTGTPTFLMNVARIFAAMSAGSAPLLLEGPPGIGKTAVVSQIASLLGGECVRINLSKNTSVQHLLGSVMPRFSKNGRVFEWQDGKLVQALRSRKWVLLDGINLAPPEVVQVLIPLLERRFSGSFHVPETNQVIALDGLHVFATMDPEGGHSRLPESFLSMFMVVRLEGYSDQELRAIMKRLFGEMLRRKDLEEQSLNDIFNLHVDFRGRVKSTREMGKSGVRPYEFNLRDLKKVRDIVEGSTTNQMAHYRLAPLESEQGLSSEQGLPSEQGLSSEQGQSLGNDRRHLMMDVSQIVVRRAVELVYAHHFQEVSDRKAAQKIIDKHLPRPGIEEESASSTVDSLVAGCVRIGSVYLPVQKDVFQNEQCEGGALTHSPDTIKQLEILTMGCQSKRAILLQGDTCSKKTALVKELARLGGGRRLLTISLHQNFETADLIGRWMPLTESTFQVEINQKATTLINDISKHLLLYVIPVQNEQARSSSIENLKKVYRLRIEAETWVFRGASQMELAQRYIGILEQLKITIDTIWEDEGMIAPPEVCLVAANMLKSLNYTLKQLEECAAALEEDTGYVFVESELVKALKLGHFILLENINSPSSEVMERLSSLLEDDPVLILDERKDGERLSRNGGGIDSETRIFATVHPKRPDTDCLSAAILNRMISVQLPGMDADLTPENCLTHDLLPILSEKFCNYPNGGSAASMLLKFHAGVKAMVERGEIIPSNGLTVNFRNLQRAAQLALHWTRKGNPAFRSAAEAVMQTYMSDMQSGAENLVKLQALFCQELDEGDTPMSDFHRLSPDLSHMRTLECSSHEMSIQMCFLEAMLVQIATKSLSCIKDASQCDGMSDSEMCRAMIRLFPAEKDSLEVAFSEIDSAKAMGKVREAMEQQQGALNPIDDSEIRDLQKRMDQASFAIQAGIEDFVGATSFLDHPDQSRFLKRIVWVAESFLSILRSTAFTNLSSKPVTTLLQAGISACNRLLYAELCLSVFTWMEQDVFIKTQKSFEDLLIGFEQEAALHAALNRELAKPIIDSKSTLAKIIKRLMVIVVETDSIVVKKYQVVLQHISLSWKNWLSVPFSPVSKPNADPDFDSKILEMELAYCVVEARKYLGQIVLGFVRLCGSAKTAMDLKTRLSTLENAVNCGRKWPDEGPSSEARRDFNTQPGEVEQVRNELKEKNRGHAETANRLQASLQKVLGGRSARFLFLWELLTAYHEHLEIHRGDVDLVEKTWSFPTPENSIVADKFEKPIDQGQAALSRIADIIRSLEKGPMEGQPLTNQMHAIANEHQKMMDKKQGGNCTGQNDDLSEALRKLLMVQELGMEDPIQAGQLLDFFQKLESTFSLNALNEAEDDLSAQIKRIKMRFENPGEAGQTQRQYLLYTALAWMKHSLGYQVVGVLERELPNSARDVTVYEACKDMIGGVLKVHETLMAYTMITLEENLDMHWLNLDDITSFCESLLKDVLMVIEHGGDHGRRVVSRMSPAVFADRQGDFDKIVANLRMPAQILDDNGLHMFMKRIAEIYEKNRIDADVKESDGSPKGDDGCEATTNQSTNQFQKKEATTSPPAAENEELHELTKKYVALLKRAQRMRPINKGLVNKILAGLQNFLKESPLSDIALARHLADHADLSKSVEEFEISLKNSLDSLEDNLNLNPKFSDTDISITTKTLTVQKTARKASAQEIERIRKELKSFIALGEEELCGSLTEDDQGGLLKYVSASIQQAMWSQTISECMDLYHSRSAEPHDLSSWAGVLSVELVVEIMHARTESGSAWGSILAKILQEFSAWRVKMLVGDESSSSMVCDHEELKRVLGPLKSIKIDLSPSLVGMRNALRHWQGLQVALQAELDECSAVLKKPACLTPPALYFADPVALLFPWNTKAFAKHCELDRCISSKSLNDRVHASKLDSDFATGLSGIASYCYLDGEERVSVFDTSMQSTMCNAIGRSCEDVVEAILSDSVGLGALFPEIFVQIHSAVTLMAMIPIIWRSWMSDSFEQYIQLGKPLPEEEGIAKKREEIEAVGRKILDQGKLIEKIKKEKEDNEKKLAGTPTFGASWQEFDALNSKQERLSVKEKHYNQELELMVSSQDLLNGILHSLEDELAGAKRVTQRSVKTAILHRMNSLLRIGMTFLNKLRKAQDPESDWEVLGKDVGLSLDGELDFYRVNVKRLVADMADIESTVEEDASSIPLVKMNEQFCGVVEACSEIDVEDPFRKGVLFMAGLFKMTAGVASRARHHLQKVRIGIRGNIGAADNAKSVLGTFHELASKTTQLSKELLSRCGALVDITMESKTREEFIKTAEHLLRLENKGTASLGIHIHRYAGCRASLDFTRMFILKFIWVHCRYLDLSQPMGSYMTELKTALMNRGLELLECDMDSEAVVLLMERLQDGLGSVAESLMCQAHHALLDFPSSPQQVMTAINDATAATGGAIFLPAAVCAEHTHKALQVLGENIVGSGVCHAEIELLCGVFEAGTRLLGKKFRGKAKGWADDLQDASVLEKHLQGMWKELVLNRPNLAGFLNEAMMRFWALKGELVAGHLLRISQDFSASLGKIEPITSPRSPQGAEDMYEPVIANAIDVQKFRAAVEFHGVDDATVRICHEIATLLKHGVPSVGEIIAGVVKRASDAFDAHTIVGWYQNASDKALEVLSSKVEILFHETAVGAAIPEIVQRLSNGAVTILELGREGVRGASIDRHSEELQDIQRQVGLVGDFWEKQGRKFIAAKKQKRESKLLKLQTAVDKAMKLFRVEEELHAEQEEIRLELLEDLGEILKLCCRIGEKGDPAFCNDRANELLRDKNWFIKQEPTFSLGSFGLELKQDAFTFRILGVTQPSLMGNHWGLSKVSKIKIICFKEDESHGLGTTVQVPIEGLHEEKIENVFEMNSQRDDTVTLDFLREDGYPWGPSITKSIQEWSRGSGVKFGHAQPFGHLQYEIHIGLIRPASLGKPVETREHRQRGLSLDNLKENFYIRLRVFNPSLREFENLNLVDKPREPELEKAALSREESNIAKEEAHDEKVFLEADETQTVKRCVECISKLVSDSETLLNAASQMLSSEKESRFVFLLKDAIDLTEGLAKALETWEPFAFRGPLAQCSVSHGDSHEQDPISMIRNDMKQTFSQCRESDQRAAALGSRVLTEAFRLVHLGLMCKAFEMSSPADIEAFKKMETKVEHLATSISRVGLLNEGAVHNSKWMSDSARSIAAFRESMISTLVKIQEIRENVKTDIGNIDPECLAGCQVTELGQVLLVEDSGVISSAPSKLVVDFGTVVHFEEGDRSQSRQMVRTIRLLNKTSEDIDFKFKSTECEGTTPPCFMIFPQQARLLSNATMNISCSLALRQMGKLEGKWAIDYGHVCSKGTLIVRAAVRRMRVEVDCETDLVSLVEIDDLDRHDSDASGFTEESSSSTKEKLEESIMQKLDEIGCLADKALDVVGMIPTTVEIDTELPGHVLHALSEAKYAAEEWMTIFQQACQMINLGHKVVDSTLQPTVVHVGIKLCIAMECLRMWMSNGYQGGQMEIRSTCAEILRLLSLIPGGNLNEDIRKAISMLQSGSAQALQKNV
ncbi:hypothetical protein BSKO_02574 [Bryopsis sp. KO-2023]|nr:hypothetical protein BSKO_02574 [Bryopsis sp. KO-2023]